MCDPYSESQLPFRDMFIMAMRRIEKFAFSLPDNSREQEVAYHCLDLIQSLQAESD